MNPLANLARAPRVETAAAEFLRDALAGLQARTKRLSPKYFYDERGSELFEEITRLPEYYLTRVELQIMRDLAAEMAERIGPDCRLVEFGSGSSLKSRLLLSELRSAAAYIPVDISEEHLLHSAGRLRQEYRHLSVLPVHADFTHDFRIPPSPGEARSTVVYFPGSTIGNFDPPEVRDLVNRVGRMVGPGGGFLVGVDLRKDVNILEAAYNDSRGITSAFNLNLLARMQRELGARLNPEDFQHLAYYNRVEGRIEMHLVSTEHQSVELGGTFIQFAAGETIHTENSYKYAPDGLIPYAAEAGMVREGVWTDPAGLFSVQFFRRAED